MTADDAPYDLRDPAGCATRAFAALARGASDRHSGHHLMAVATLADGSPTVRTVVLRHCDTDQRTVRFHADTRSPKIAELRGDDRLALMLYDPGTRVQIRIAARATIHTADVIARAAWAESQPMSRACYAATVPPSAVLPSPDPLVAPPPPDADDETALSHFAAVVCRFDELELLSLHATGHVRFRLEWVGGWTLTPLAP